MKAMRNSAEILFIGQFPPPINGFTFVTSRLSAALSAAGYDLIVVSTTAFTTDRTILFHASRVLNTLSALFSIASHSVLNGSRHCYLAAEGNLGLIYSVTIAAWARIFKLHLFIHHHSYSYINCQSVLMRLLLWCSGTEAVHICLSSDMAQTLANCYEREIYALVLSNAALIDPPEQQESKGELKEITIGLLSNLTQEKGLYEFIEILDLAKRHRLPFRGILAGPILQDTDRRRVEEVQKKLSGFLEYRGPVYGTEKVCFFKDLDVFVFPTAYSNEAQPLVLFEALSYGIPVISCDRGCIRSQVGPAGHVVHAHKHFVQEALQVLNTYLQDQNVLATHKKAAQDKYASDRRDGETKIARLFNQRPVKFAPTSSAYQSRKLGEDTWS
jgi:glycosyltransferase involved in cell wall biosynthesis